MLPTRNVCICKTRIGAGDQNNQVYYLSSKRSRFCRSPGVSTASRDWILRRVQNFGVSHKTHVHVLPRVNSDSNKSFGERFKKVTSIKYIYYRKKYIRQMHICDALRAL